MGLDAAHRERPVRSEQDVLCAESLLGQRQRPDIVRDAIDADISEYALWRLQFGIDAGSRRFEPTLETSRQHRQRAAAVREAKANSVEPLENAAERKMADRNSRLVRITQQVGQIKGAQPAIGAFARMKKRRMHRHH